MATMTVKELADDLGLTDLMTREAIKENKFQYFAWTIPSRNGSLKRCKIYINKERYDLWKQGKDIELVKKVLNEN